jgi:hypothetical protein
VIDFLFWEGCPSHERALGDLTKLLDEFEISSHQLSITEVKTDADAQRERFIGSPTIRVNGTDVVDPGETPFGLDCRVYYRRDGKVSPLPVHDVVRAAIASYATNTKTGT